MVIGRELSFYRNGLDALHVQLRTMHPFGIIFIQQYGKPSEIVVSSNFKCRVVDWIESN